MSEYSQYVIDKIREYKCLDGHEILKCPLVTNSEGKAIAYLRPITKDSDTAMPEWIKLLTKWRKQNPSLSDNEFVPTEDRTRKWVKDSVIYGDDKILFMILDVHGRALGHIGLCGFAYQERKAIVYSVLRGVLDAPGGLMEASLRCLIEWSKKELGIENFELNTQKTNERAVRLYKKTGFEIVEEIPLKKVVCSDEIKWVPDSPDKVNAEKYRIRMVYRG